MKFKIAKQFADCLEGADVSAEDVIGALVADGFLVEATEEVAEVASTETTAETATPETVATDSTVAAEPTTETSTEAAAQ